MSTPSLTVATTVPATADTAWHYYTEAEHVINWNFASEDWHCPKAVNDLRVGGTFLITMAAKEGDMSFDMEGIYDEVKAPQHLAYTLTDKRKVRVEFAESDGRTEVKITFDPEPNTAEDQQRKGWQAIADSYRAYVTRMEKSE